MKADERLFDRGKERWVIKEDEDMEEEGGGFSCFMLYFFKIFLGAELGDGHGLSALAPFFAFLSP